MKPKVLTCITAIAVFAALAAPVGTAAQDRPGHHKGHGGYAVTNLGTLGGTFAVGNAISNSGWVAGAANLKGDTVEHAFLWTKKSGMTDLGTLGGPNSFVGWPVDNERGLLAGVSDTSNPDPYNENFCGFGTGLICLGFLWEDDVMSPLGTLGGNNSYASGVNNRGQAVGVAESTLDSNCTPPQVFDYQAVIWGPKSGEIHQLNPLSGDPVGYALAINQKGQVVGATGPCVPLAPLPHAVLWEKDGTPINLGNLGGALNNVAGDINDRGEVVGGSDLAGDTYTHAFLWTKDNGMQDLGTLSGDVNSSADGINNRGQVVGSSCDASGNCRAFLWTKEEGMQDLNTLVCAGTKLYLTNSDGADISDRGEITGEAYDPNSGATPAYLAVPTHGNGHCEAGPYAGQKVILPENVRQRAQQQRRFGPFAVGMK